MSDNQQTLLQLYCREQQAQKLLDKHDLDSDLSESADYLKWCESKRNFVAEDVLGRTWVKSCPAGYITEVHFHSNGSLTEYRLFDRFETQGHWLLKGGLLHVEISKGDNRYQFDVVACKDLNIHSAVEYKSQELHSYLKLVQVEAS
ncbi:hypothetical protein L1D37_03895 [Vibrio sp. Isolate33]|uniref:hypothetical protein n=1 Tax=Vibrio sp. Isolate33 TaxID=2908539 RepID=UPI001EFD4349|nr:hypothetical protein [Vibrio sp. Isolate33]MCG9542917.1 hypothetical protein [Vibrio sp. Isolate33]